MLLAQIFVCLPFPPPHPPPNPMTLGGEQGYGKYVPSGTLFDLKQLAPFPALLLVLVLVPQNWPSAVYIDTCRQLLAGGNQQTKPKQISNYFDKLVLHPKTSIMCVCVCVGTFGQMLFFIYFYQFFIIIFGSFIFCHFY